MSFNLFKNIVVSAFWAIIGAMGVKGIIPNDESMRRGCGEGCVWFGMIVSLILPFGAIDWKYYVTNEHEKVSSNRLTMKEALCQGLFSLGILGIMVDAMNVIDEINDYVVIMFLFLMIVCAKTAMDSDKKLK